MSNVMKMTRQGVRDLSFMKAPPPKPRRDMSELPAYMLGVCKHPKHKRRKIANNESECVGCGKMWDGEGNEFQDSPN